MLISDKAKACLIVCAGLGAGTLRAWAKPAWLAHTARARKVVLIAFINLVLGFQI